MVPRIIFMGSPDFAVPALQSISKKFEILCVVTQPDRIAGRGQVIQLSAVKKAAQKLGLNTIQPQKLREPGVFHQLAAYQPDLIVVAAYGQILKPDILNLPKYGCINIHASLLPRWRGATPIQASILAGDTRTGVTIIKMDEGIDSGPIIAQKPIDIAKEDTTYSLTTKLSDLGASLIVDSIYAYLEKGIQPVPQSTEEITLTRQISKDDGILDFTLPAEMLERQIRAYYPWPGSFFEIGGQRVKVLKAEVVLNEDLPSGKRSIFQKYPIIGTATGGIKLIEIQPAGKKPMSGSQYLIGARNWME